MFGEFEGDGEMPKSKKKNHKEPFQLKEWDEAFQNKSQCLKWTVWFRVWASTVFSMFLFFKIGTRTWKLHCSHLPVCSGQIRPLRFFKEHVKKKQHFPENVRIGWLTNWQEETLSASVWHPAANCFMTFSNRLVRRSKCFSGVAEVVEEVVVFPIIPIIFVFFGSVWFHQGGTNNPTCPHNPLKTTLKKQTSMQTFSWSSCLFCSSMDLLPLLGRKSDRYTAVIVEEPASYVGREVSQVQLLWSVCGGQQRRWRHVIFPFER